MTVGTANNSRPTVSVQGYVTCAKRLVKSVKLESFNGLQFELEQNIGNTECMHFHDDKNQVSEY